jgi:glutamate carboxypeptidase
LGVPISWRYSGGVSDGNQLAAAGLANIDSLGPRGGSIHSDNEFLLLDSLPERAKLAVSVLLHLAKEAGTGGWS